MYYNGMDGEPQVAEKNVRVVDGQLVTTWKREVCSCNVLEVEAGTNGYQGGDGGHGCRVYLRVKDLAGTGFCNEVDGKYLDDRQDEYVLALCGDTELSTIKEALRWMISVLEAQSEGVG